MASTPIDIIVRASVNQATGSLKKLAAAFGAFSALVIANTLESQKATAQLNSAFANVNKTVGVTRKSLDDLATSLQQTTTFGDDLVKTAESVLLTFNKVRGEGFERTIRAATDLSARFGTDLVSTTRTLGKALQDPIRGLIQLQRQGVTFSDAQKELIKNLVETGQRAAAQNIILSEVEKRFKGAAEAARNTLGGALEGLKNAFGDLFEASDAATADSVKAINGLSIALADPKIKEGIDNLIAGFAKLIELLARFIALTANAAVQFGGFLGKSIAKLMGLQTNQEKINLLLKEEIELRRLASQGRQDTKLESFLSGKEGSNKDFRDEIAAKGIKPEDEKAFFEQRLRVIRAQRKSLQQTISTTPITDAINKAEKAGTSTSTNSSKDEEDERLRKLAQVSEVEITLRKKVKDANQEVIDELNESTRTESEQAIAKFNETKAKLLELRKISKEDGGIDAEKFNERLKEAQDELLPEVDLQKIREMFKKVETQASETSEIVKGAFREAGASIQSSLSDAIQGGRLSLKSLVDVARKAFADIVAALIVSGIKKALANQLSGSGSSGGSGSTGGGILKSVLGAFLGGRAGGGNISQGRSAIVGEEGPELATALPGGGVKIFNRRMLNSSDMGGSFAFSPVTNIQIVERDDPQKTKREIFAAMAVQQAKQEERIYSRLSRNGVNVR